jgi:uncharacterized RDD family membrane protein YckC
MTEQINYPKADLMKRFVAFFIDYCIAYFIGFVPFIGGLAGMAYMLLRDGFEWDFMKHRSLGKTLLKLKIVVLEGENKTPDLSISVQRNWILTIPLALMIIPFIGWLLIFPALIIIYLMEGLKVINSSDGRRYGDTAAKTIVIEEKPAETQANASEQELKQ